MAEGRKNRAPLAAASSAGPGLVLNQDPWSSYLNEANGADPAVSQNSSNLDAAGGTEHTTAAASQRLNAEDSIDDIFAAVIRSSTGRERQRQQHSSASHSDRPLQPNSHMSDSLAAADQLPYHKNVPAALQHIMSLRRRGRPNYR